MINTHRFERAGLPVRPWKNGGGVTREIVSWPVGSSVRDFDWRVSIAHIASSGAFSTFPGVDRVITLLEGSGVKLHSVDNTVNHRLDQPMRPFAFAGDKPVQANLLGPDCHDFNVMTRRAVCSASVQVISGNTALPTPAQGLFFCNGGHWLVNAHKLALGEGLWWHDGPRTWTLKPDSEQASLLAVLIQATQ